MESRLVSGALGSQAVAGRGVLGGGPGGISDLWPGCVGPQEEKLELSERAQTRWMGGCGSPIADMARRVKRD